MRTGGEGFLKYQLTANSNIEVSKHCGDKKGGQLGSFLYYPPKMHREEGVLFGSSVWKPRFQTLAWRKGFFDSLLIPKGAN